MAMGVAKLWYKSVHREIEQQTHQNEQRIYRSGKQVFSDPPPPPPPAMKEETSRIVMDIKLQLLMIHPL